MGRAVVLRLEAIETYYGTSQVLFGLSLEVRHGEVVTLLGRNGMGKTTTVRSLMGLTPIRAGTITLDGAPLHTLPPYRIARRGLGLVPEGRQIFANLSVRENLVATATRRQTTDTLWTLERIYDLFPALKARQHHMGAQLSGGEQQMLALGRALMTNPRLLILDEATEGLAPLLRAEIWRVLRHLKATGQSIFLIDKHVSALMRLADRHYIIVRGQVVWSGTSQELRADAAVRQRYLGV
jgi:branched-chain amino acid transport system ATP-binding protein